MDGSRVMKWALGLKGVKLALCLCTEHSETRSKRRMVSSYRLSNNVVIDLETIDRSEERFIQEIVQACL